MVKLKGRWKGRQRNKLKDCAMIYSTLGLGLSYGNGNEWTNSKESINEELTQIDEQEDMREKGVES